MEAAISGGSRRESKWIPDTFFSRHVRDSMCNGKFRAAADDKFVAVHSNIFRVLGAQGSRDYLDRRAPEGDVPLLLHIHKSFVDRTTNPYPTGRRLLFAFSLFSICLFIRVPTSVLYAQCFFFFFLFFQTSYYFTNIFCNY